MVVYDTEAVRALAALQQAEANVSTPTPVERAAEAMRRHFGFAVLPGDWAPDGPEDGLPGLALCIADAIRAAVEEERERCARLALGEEEERAGRIPQGSFERRYIADCIRTGTPS